MIGNAVSVFWFRRDLRLSDNHGLFHALKSNYPLLAVFIFDTNILSQLPDHKDKRVSFIHEYLSNINEELKKKGSSLLVLHDKPLNAFGRICNMYDVRNVFTNHDYEPGAIERDREVEKFLASKQIPFLSFKDQVIFERSEVMKSDGTPYTIFTPYSKIWKRQLTEEHVQCYDSERYSSNFLKTEPFRIPGINEIGFEKTAHNVLFPLVDEKIIAGYHNTRNFPAVNGTSRLSVHLHFGTISIRYLVKKALELNEQWLNELIWREFFMMILYYFPEVVTKSFKRKYDLIEWRNDEKEFELWCRGETGYPIVDAGMRELNETGFMHNRVRMVVASFLTKHLLIDWRWGEAYFAEKLTDYELSSNNGNWQWAAGCGCDAAPYFRLFNPAEQTRKFDPGQQYIKKWLGNITEYGHKLVVEHEFARNRAIATYKKALMERSAGNISLKQNPDIFI